MAILYCNIRLSRTFFKLCTQFVLKIFQVGFSFSMYQFANTKLILRVPRDQVDTLIYQTISNFPIISMEIIDFWGFCLKMEKIFQTNGSIFHMVFLTPCLKMRFQENRTMVLKTVYQGIKVPLLCIILYRHQEKPWYHYVHGKYLTKKKECAGGVFFLY